MLLSEWDGVNTSQRDSLVALSKVPGGDLGRLAGFVSKDLKLAGTVASLRWFLDGTFTSGELHALNALEEIASHDLELAMLLASAPWLVDGVTSTKNNVLRDLRSIVLTDLELAGMMKSIPWLYDAITDDTSAIIRSLDTIASENPELARTVASLDWFLDGVSRNEKVALGTLKGIVELDQGLARLVTEAPWFVDGISRDEGLGLISVKAALEALSSVNMGNHDLLRTVRTLPWLEQGWNRNLYRWSLLSLHGIFQLFGTDILGQLTAQPWFADGLENEELALIAVLDSIISHPQLYNDLIQTSFTRSATVSLPLAGEVNLWVFQPQPFHHSQEDVLPMLEDSVRIMEEFMGVPFPVTDVILVVPIIGPEVDHGIGRGSHWVDFITVTRYETSPLHDWEAIYHEVAHYYFEGGFGPPWLVEGGAEFMWMYIRENRTGLGDIENQHPGAVLRLQENCYSRGIRSLQQLNELQSSEPDLETTCHYSLGAYFLFSLYKTLGEEAVSAALRELYLLLQSEGSAAVTEEEIYQAFLRNTPPGLEEEFLALYREFHTPDFLAEEAETPLPA